jgi:hypothetical protein
MQIPHFQIMQISHFQTPPFTDGKSQFFTLNFMRPRYQPQR